MKDVIILWILSSYRRVTRGSGNMMMTPHMHVHSFSDAGFLMTFLLPRSLILPILQDLI